MDTTRTPCRAVGTRGQLWPRARSVRSDEHSSEHSQTRAKMTSGTLNVAGTGPLAGDFSRARARPSLSLSLRHNARES